MNEARNAVARQMADLLVEAALAESPMEQARIASEINRLKADEIRKLETEAVNALESIASGILQLARL